MATNIPDSLKQIIADSLAHDCFNKEESLIRIRTFYLDLNRSSSGLTYLHRTVDLQQVMKDTIEQINTESPNSNITSTDINNEPLFRQLFIYNVCQKSKINNHKQVESILKFLSQDISVAYQSTLIYILCANHHLKLEDIDCYGTEMAEKFLKSASPASPLYSNPTYHAHLQSDGSIKVTSSIQLDKIIAADGTEFISENAEVNISKFEFTVNPKTQAITVHNLTLPQLVYEYKQAQKNKELPDAASNHSSIKVEKPKGFDMTSKFKKFSINNILNYLIERFYNLQKLLISFLAYIFKKIVYLKQAKIKPEKPVLEHNLEKFGGQPAARPAAIGWDYNYQKLKLAKEMAAKDAEVDTSQVQPPAPCRSPRAH